MAKYITASGASTLPNVNAIEVQVNTALTGTITLSTANGGTFAVITNPTVGSLYKYGGLIGQGAITVNPSATCDITVTLLNNVT